VSSRAIAAALVVSGCIVDPDIGALPPPCAPGYAPDPSGTRCVMGANDGGTRDAGPSLEVSDVDELLAAIALAESMPGTQTIALAAGTYELAEELVLRSDIDLAGPAGIDCGAILRAIGDHRVLRVEEGIVTLDRIGITGGRVEGTSGAGIRAESGTQLTLRQSCVNDNRAIGNATGGGGGIAVLEDTVLVLSRTRVSGNYAEDQGAGIHADGAAQIAILDSEISENELAGDVWGRMGAGLYVSSCPDLRIERTLFAENEESIATGVYGSGIGVSATQGVVRNVTFSGNVGTFGVAAYLQEGSHLDFEHVTIAFNRGTDSSSRAVWMPGGSASFTNSIFEDNTANDGAERNCHDEGDGESRGNNVASSMESETLDCGIQDGANNDAYLAPLLLPLADNGGFARTHALDPASPAIGRAGSNCAAEDQRGIARNTPCDSGAFEN
jgi:hypothetical protein